MDISASYMKRALSLATRGRGNVHPNPLVGAVVVKDGTVIGEGAHTQLGHSHAEINALRDISGDPHGATMYVNLEPCTYHGRTPPCVPAIINAGIHSVVVGTEDPNPKVSGSGIRQLREAGIEVKVGVLEQECRELNRGFIRYMETGFPWVTLKLASTIDGFIADRNGVSKWVTGSESRKLVHQWRSEHDAVLVGANTVATDDPQLTVRAVEGANPVRIVVDSRQVAPETARVFRDADAETILVTDPESGNGQWKSKHGIQTVTLSPDAGGMFDWEEILRRLAGEKGILSVFVEGGAEVASSLMRSGYVNELIIMTAPKIIGQGLSPFRHISLPLEGAVQWSIYETGRSGKDSYVRYRSRERG